MNVETLGQPKAGWLAATMPPFRAQYSTPLRQEQNWGHVLGTYFEAFYGLNKKPVVVTRFDSSAVGTYGTDFYSFCYSNGSVQFVRKPPFSPACAWMDI